ncbi:capsular biosynthesis protein [Macrococcoides canis]|uniref:Capsular biosynthesis protein n=1 Tax=Macrococcoides canis TaxID=1855823 RepID=A0AAE7BZN2_9STAP|nr:capsular biosynthesis protein [Macrococcus canis]QIH77982.1 capsular biosynthesis protein [Macrococcus canis]
MKKIAILLNILGCFLIVYFLLIYNLSYLSLALTYFACSNLLFIFINNSQIKYTSIIYNLYGLLRLFIIPLLMSIKNDNVIDNLPFGWEYFNTGVSLICIEYFIGTLFLIFLSRYVKPKDRHGDFQLMGSKIVYIPFIIIIIIISILFPEVRQTMSFLILKTDGTGRIVEDTPALITLIRFFIQLALLLIFVIVSYNSYRKYRVNPSVSYILLPALTALLNISVIIGERRSIQLYLAFSVLIVSTKLFVKHSKQINILIIISVVTIILFMTLYKELYIFKYGSYSEALNNTSVKDIKLVDQLQSYFYGPHNVGSIIVYLKFYSASFSIFINEVFRNFFLINFLVDDSGLLTSQKFNYLVYGNKQLTGHLISSASYGYVYFGKVLFPIVIIFNILVTITFEQLIKKTKSIEVIFISAYLFARCAQNIFGSPIPIINFTTMTVGVYGTIIAIAFVVKKLTEGVRLND